MPETLRTLHFPLRYDGTINAGHILTILTIASTAIGAFFYVQSDLKSLTESQQRLEMTVTRDMNVIQAEASDREARLRGAELTLAGQASDLRAISNSLIRIERLLDNRSPQ